MARAVAPGIPHHVTQRGNRRQQTFFNNEDYQSYLELMSEWCMKFRVETWAYCLMPNHIHLIVLPETKDGLNQAIAFCSTWGFVEVGTHVFQLGDDPQHDLLIARAVSVDSAETGDSQGINR